MTTTTEASPVAIGSSDGTRAGADPLPPRAAVCPLDDPAALDANLVGAKAAALARACAVRIAVIPGFVVTTAGAAMVEAATGDPGAYPPDVQVHWDRLSAGGQRALVVRSSSPVEDLASSSMAGRFESVVGVDGWDGFVDAVATVLASRFLASDGDDAAGSGHPMAVLVQPLLDAVVGGVLFGVDPVTGRSDRVVVAVGTGAPRALVSGEVAGDRYELDLGGAVHQHVVGDGGARLARRDIQRLVALGQRVADVFGGPQDVEWAIDRNGKLWLLQSRPVTTAISGRPTGPVLGPGPVAETFPEPLTRLEEALWIDPLRRALRTVFELIGTASRAQLDASPLVTTVDGHVAVDLELFGEVDRAGSRWSALDPRQRVRRLRASWRVGRLRAALPALAEDLLGRTDAELSAVPDLDELTDRQLLALLDRSAKALVAVHGHEVLIGLLVSTAAPRFTGASVALRVLARARQEGLSDQEIVARFPVVLALVPPHVQPFPPLPPTESAPDWAAGEHGDRAALLREALRLRARWLQELGGRAAWLLGRRLADRAALATAADVRVLSVASLRDLVTDQAAVERPAGPGPPRSSVPPLPARFRLTELGRPVAVRATSNGHGGSGAGGGRGSGPVFTGDGVPPDGVVLVVRTLDPHLAPVLPHLAGLVAETGSVLAHLAILAREAGVPTVVGLADALDRFPDGTIVTVDGTTGAVTENTP